MISLTPRRLCGLPLVDVVGAVLLAVAAVGSIVTKQVVEGPMRLTIPVALAMTLAVAWRTQAPLYGAGVLAGAIIIQSVFGDGGPGSVVAFAVILIFAYSVGAELEEAPGAIGLVVVLGSVLVGEKIDNGVDYVFLTLVFGGAWLGGRGSRAWRTRAAYAEEHQHDLARLAVAQERASIAREMHDVVAHGLGVIAIQAAAAEAALDHDYKLARNPVVAIQASARDALSDMRQLLNVLRTDDANPGTCRLPARSIGDLDALVSSMRSAGLPVTADLSGLDCLADLPAGLSLTVYRVAQEGLTNVLKHAGPVPTMLRVGRSAQGIDIVVRNAPDSDAPDMATASRPDSDSVDTTYAGLAIPGSLGGQGLIGVRERAIATGGSMRTEVSPDGSFMMTVCLSWAGQGRDGELA